MSNLSNEFWRALSSACYEQYGIRPRPIAPDGRGRGPSRPVDEVETIRNARVHGLAEGVRWGEPYIFFLAPGILSWIVPLVEDRDLRGGLIGGEVVAEDGARDRAESTRHLTEQGLEYREAASFVGALPAWPQVQTQAAADFLYREFYRRSGWIPAVLDHHRDRALQQRQIAEEIHRRKHTQDMAYPISEERRLLSLIRAGDRNRAREVLNRFLAAAFLQSSDLVVIRALMIELMGYLVRAAVEDSPYLEFLMRKNHQWMARIIEAPDFEVLTHVVRDALDDFIQNIYLLGYNPTHPAVGKALDYIAAHYREPVAVADVAAAAGLSPSRLSHVLKEHTGKSVLAQVLHLRVQEARRLLETTTTSCADIAYEVGFGDQSYFTKQFRRHTGITPARHRHQYRGRGAA